MSEQKREALWLVLILPLIVAVCLFIWHMRADIAQGVFVDSDTPDWYLHEYDFDEVYVRTQGSISEYVPNALLTPEEFDDADWIVGKPKNAADYLTARFRLHVPDGRVYVLTSDSVDFAERIFINGQLYQEVGRPAERREMMIPQTRQMYFTVSPDNGVIEILRQYSNFVHRDGGNPVGFRIGSVETAGRHYDRINGMAALVMGACLLLFLVHIVLFLMQRSYKANLYFALVCLTWLFRTAVSNEKVITLYYPEISWILKFKIEYITMPLACMMAALAVDSMMPGLMQKWPRRIIVFIETVFVLIFALTDTLLMSRALIASHLFIVLTALYVIVRFILQFSARRDIEHIIFFAGMLVFVYLAVREMLFHYQIRIFPDMASGMLDFAMLVFILFQMVSAFYGTMRQVRIAQQNQQALATENAALDRVNRMKNDLMANLTHEIRTPLTVMSAYAQLAVEAVQDGSVDEQAAEDLKLISGEAKRLANLASDVLHVFSERDTENGMTAFSVETVIRQVGRLAAPMLDKNKSALQIDIEDGLPQAYGRTEECTQLLWNLITNAATYSKGSPVVLQVRTRTMRGSAMIEVTVEDRGDGMPESIRAHVFERHVAGHGGSGLGLSICKEIVEAHGGQIELESAVGEGTTVRFSLPTAPEEAGK